MRGIALHGLIRTGSAIGCRLRTVRSICAPVSVSLCFVFSFAAAAAAVLLMRGFHLFCSVTASVHLFGLRRVCFFFSRKVITLRKKKKKV